MATQLARVTATGDAVARKAYLKSILLTAGIDAATLDVRDGSGGAVVLSFKAAANTSASWVSGDADGVFFGTAVHFTFTGTSPSATAEVE